MQKFLVSCHHIRKLTGVHRVNSTYTTNPYSAGIAVWRILFQRGQFRGFFTSSGELQSSSSIGVPEGGSLLAELGWASGSFSFGLGTSIDSRLDPSAFLPIDCISPFSGSVLVWGWRSMAPGAFSLKSHGSVMQQHLVFNVGQNGYIYKPQKEL